MLSAVNAEESARNYFSKVSVAIHQDVQWRSGGDHLEIPIPEGGDRRIGRCNSKKSKKPDLLMVF